MSKLIIAIDMGDLKPGACIASKYPMLAGQKEPDYITDPTDLSQVKVGDQISFDHSYIEIDQQDDSFRVAEFRGWEE